MQRRAQLIVGGLAVLGIVLLARAGLIDARRGPGEPVLVTVTTQATASGSAADADRVAVRRWLRNQLVSTAAMPETRLAQLLPLVEEDARDPDQLRVLPSGRRMPRSADGQAWQAGFLWPPKRGLADDPVARSDLHNVRAVERQAALPDDPDFADDPGPERVVPDDSVKGDIARGLFYMALRYDGTDGGARLELVTGEVHAPMPAMGELCTLLRWNEADGVDAAERRRDERVARYQGNRNPFVERPEFARVLWGDQCR